MSLESLMPRRDFLRLMAITTGTLALPEASFAGSKEYKLVLGEEEIAEMAAKFLGLDPRKVADYFGAITAGKINPKAERSLNDLWPGDEIAFNLDKVPQEHRGSVEAKLKKYDALHGKPDDGTFSLPHEQYDKAVLDMTHGHLNAKDLQTGKRVLTLYRVEEKHSVDGVVRRFKGGGTPEDDEIGSKEGAIYKAVRAEDVAAAMKELEGKYVFGLGNLFDFHLEVGKDFAALIKTAVVGLKNPLDQHYAVSKEGRLHKLIDRKNWKYDSSPALPAPGSATRAVLRQVYDALVWGPGFETPGTFEGQLGAPIYKPKK